MDVATIKGATHNPGAPSNWTEANGTCGTLPIVYRKDSHGNPECVSAWKPSESDLKTLNEGGFVLLSVIGWQVPCCVFVGDNESATAGRTMPPSAVAKVDTSQVAPIEALPGDPD